VSKEKNTEQKEKIISPDDINSYLRVTSPSMWFVLAAVIILIIGVIAGSLFSTISTTEYVDAKVKGGIIHLGPANNIDYEVDMEVNLLNSGGDAHSFESYTVKIESLTYGEDGDDCAAEVYTYSDIPDGKYTAEVTEKVTPIEYLFK